MFRSVHGHVLAPSEVVLVDEGAAPFDVESYLTRLHAKIAREEALEDSAKIDLERLVSSVRTETPGQSSPLEPVPENGGLKIESFHDFADLYHGKNFVGVADTTEALLNKANKQMHALEHHLRSEGGMSVIRIRHPETRQLVAKRCVLLPSVALRDWAHRLSSEVRRLLDESFRRYSNKYMAQIYKDDDKMTQLFYFKRIGIDARDRENFKDVPLWKMEVMLKKWRTDRALKQWIDNYKFKRQ